MRREALEGCSLKSNHGFVFLFVRIYVPGYMYVIQRVMYATVIRNVLANVQYEQD